MQVFVNAGSTVVPDWRSAIFDIEEFINIEGNKRLVLIKDDENELQRVPLIKWVNSQNAGLRGNTRGILYHDKKNGWVRLNDQLLSLKEVRATALCSDLVISLMSARPISVESAI